MATPAGIEALTAEQQRALAELLHAAQWLGTISYSQRFSSFELEALALRGYGHSIAQSACRLAEVPLGEDGASGHELTSFARTIRTLKAMGLAGESNGRVFLLDHVRTSMGLS
jgi:hypothetical protein